MSDTRDVTSSESSSGGASSGFAVRRIPDDDGLALVTTGWRFLKIHYALLAVTSLIAMGIAIAVSRIPYLSILAPLPIILLTAGQMRIVRRLMAGETSSRASNFKELFYAFEDSKWMNALLPLGAAGVVISILQLGLGQITDGGVFASLFGSLMSLGLSLVWLALTAFSIPMIVFHGIPFVDSIDINLKATVLNWKPLLLYSVFMTGVGFLCAILLVVPLFLVFVPLVYVTSYFCYASMFEGLDVSALSASLEQKQS